MGLFAKKNKELRAAPGEVGFEDPLLVALLGGGEVTKQMALAVPTVSGGIDMIAGIVASTPIKLYEEADGKAREVKNDPRIRLLNDDTGDTLDANQFWRAMIRDYYTGKGGYAYIHRKRGRFSSLHYVDEAAVSIQKNSDPIFKDYAVAVNGQSYIKNTRIDSMNVTLVFLHVKAFAKIIRIPPYTRSFYGIGIIHIANIYFYSPSTPNPAFSLQGKFY